MLANRACLRRTHPLPRGGSDCVQVEYQFESGISNPKTVLGYSQNHLAVAGGYAVGTLDSSSQRHIVRGNLTVHDPKTKHTHSNRHRCQSRRSNRVEPNDRAASIAWRGTAARNGCHSNLRNDARGATSSNWKVKSSRACTACASGGFVRFMISSALPTGAR